MMTDRLTVPDVWPLIAPYYLDHRAGGSLHIVLEDCNVDDKFVIYCKEYAVEEGDADGVRIADLLLSLTKTQRLKVCHLWSMLGSVKDWPTVEFGIRKSNVEL